MPDLPPPALPTLDQKPTWHNRASRIDRSACLPLTASALRKLLPPDAWRNYRAAPAPGSRNPNAKVQRLARATLQLTTADLLALQRTEKPRPLAGDYRTAKSNAMKPPAPQTRRNPRSPRASAASDPQRAAACRRGPTTNSDPPSPRERAGVRAPTNTPNQPTRTADAESPSAPRSLDPSARSPYRFPDARLPANPNRGAARVKTLGLPPDQTHTFTLERWRLHARLTQHFLICPHCKRKTRMLFFVLATEPEHTDARVAQHWLTHQTDPNKPLSESARKIITRYTPLFTPRHPRCRTCLNLRYGEVKRGS